jgi:hypothetical protein
MSWDDRAVRMQAAGIVDSEAERPAKNRNTSRKSFEGTSERVYSKPAAMAAHGYR